MDPLLDGQNYIYMHYADMISNGYHRLAPCPFQTQGVMLNPNGDVFFCENSDVVGNVRDEDPGRPSTSARRARRTATHIRDEKCPTLPQPVPDERRRHQAGRAVREVPRARLAGEAQGAPARAHRPAALIAAAASLAAVLACGADPPPEPSSATQPAPAMSARAAARGDAPSAHLSVDGTTFRTPDGRPFHWRGVTAFRLLEQLASGNGDAVDRYLAWAAGEQLTVVRVLAMAQHLFELPPATGRRHLDDLLVRAAGRGLYVEIVALADTADIAVPLEEQVRAVGAIAQAHPNAIVELANEPYHQTQRAEVNDVRTLSALLSLVPDEVPVAVGAAGEPGGITEGDFITYHFPRSSGAGGWGHVRDLVLGRDMLARIRKPVVNDEPIGAGAVTVPGRRDSDPVRFEAAALLTRMIGMGATFHYEGGLNAAIPEGRELECFRAWQSAWRLLPPDIETTAVFRLPGESGAASAQVTGAGVRGLGSPDGRRCVASHRPAGRWRQRDLERGLAGDGCDANRAW